MSFGKKITDIRIAKNWTIRTVALKLKTMSSATYSKIERGIQNPTSKEMFDDIISALEIVDKKEIESLEQLAMTFIPPKEMSEEELVQHLPVFLPPNVDKKDLEKLTEIIKESNLPDLPNK